MPDIDARSGVGRTLGIVFVLVALCSTPAHAQQRAAVAVAVPAVAGGYRIAREAVAVPNDDTWRTRDLWKWTGIGTLGGVIAAEGWVALEIARNHADDGMIVPIVPIVLIGAAGGAGGGLIGAIAYTASHPSPGPSPH